MIKAIEPVTIKLDRERELVITMGALMRAERMINRQRREDGEQATSIFRLIDEQIVGIRDLGLSAQFLNVMIWAILSDADPALTMSDTGKMINNPLEAAAKLCEAVGRYFTPGRYDDDAVEVGDAERPLDQRNGSVSGQVPEP